MKKLLLSIPSAVIILVSLAILVFAWSIQQTKLYQTMTASLQVTALPDGRTGAIVRGSRDEIKRMEYEWILVRPTGTKSTGSHTHITICPNCGAELALNHAGACAYCGSVIETRGADWAVSEIKGLSQRTIKNKKKGD